MSEWVCGLIFGACAICNLDVTGKQRQVWLHGPSLERDHFSNKLLKRDFYDSNVKKYSNCNLVSYIRFAEKQFELEVQLRALFLIAHVKQRTAS